MTRGPHRLSRHVLFVDWGDHIEVRHTATGGSFAATRSEHRDLLAFCGFRGASDAEAKWIDAHVLLPPGGDDRLVMAPGTEAHLAKTAADWYWAHEVESEREYKWLGWPIVKSPSDVFFYQELIAARRVRSVLEIGSGDGGGLWFFATILSQLDGGVVVGIERDPPAALPPFGLARGVAVECVHGDANSDEVRARVRAAAPACDLIVVDIGADSNQIKKLVLPYAELLAERGVLVLEDASANELLWLDDVLLADRALGLLPDAARYPFLKGRGAVLQRLPTSPDNP